jgi:hypothetical protein
MSDEYGETIGVDEEQLFEQELDGGQALSGPPLVPEGYHEAVLQEVTLEVNRSDESKGIRPFIRWQYQVIEGEFAGRTLRNDTYLTQNAFWTYMNTLRAFGYTKQQLAEEAGWTPRKALEYATSLVGDKVCLLIKHNSAKSTDRFTGEEDRRTYANINGIYPTGWAERNAV